jgi:nucleoredoxin
MQSLLGPTLVRKSGASVPLAEALAGKKFVAVYFSAHWCPPCRAFTPVLSKFFTENADKLGLALVFVSSDQDEDAFKDYFASMSWDLALPFEDSHKEVVGGDVKGIPTLKIFDAETGKLVCGNARGGLSQDPTGAKFPNY